MTALDQQQPGTPERAAAPGPGRRDLAEVLGYDVVAPLAVYYALRAAGASTVTALVVSGLPPAARVISRAVRRHSIDPVGVLVLAGIVVGAVVGLASHSARLVLLEGVVPTAVFGVVCLASLLTGRPMMFRVAQTFMGDDTERGRDFASLWRHANFRRGIRIITAVWGTVYLVEASLKTVLVLSLSISTAKAVGQVLPFVVAVPVIVWNVAYGKRMRARGERLAAEGHAAAGAATARG